MNKNIIVHTTDICADGSGDLAYFLNWLKVFQKFYKGPHQQLVMIFADDMNKLKASLLALRITEPNHPVFKYYRTTETSIKAAMIDNQKIGRLIQPNSPVYTLDLKIVFPQILDNDMINVFKISTSGNFIYKNLAKSIKVDSLFGIFEIDSLTPQLKTPYYSTLGLEPEDLGLLHDIEGITGTEDLDGYLEQLPSKYKQLMFQDSNISISAAKEQLATIPTVFAYLFPLYDAHVLQAALDSPIVQTAIAEGHRPLFFITNMHEGVTIPTSITEAAQQGKIRIVQAWIPPLEYKNINAILMNHATNSIIVPSGDNTLTACIKAGKFPLYSHKIIPAAINFPIALIGLAMPSKLGMFKSMLKILNENAQQHAWHEIKGFKQCKMALEYVIMATDNSQKTRNAAKKLHEAITPEMLNFFREMLAPYIMDNFAFEKKSLPDLLSRIAVKDFGTQAEPTAVASTTLQFDALKIRNADAAKVKHETNSAFGFKPGFLKPQPKNHNS